MPLIFGNRFLRETSRQLGASIAREGGRKTQLVSISRNQVTPDALP
jgi:hypothetical protein